MKMRRAFIFLKKLFAPCYESGCDWIGQLDFWQSGNELQWPCGQREWRSKFKLADDVSHSLSRYTVCQQAAFAMDILSSKMHWNAIAVSDKKKSCSDAPNHLNKWFQCLGHIICTWMMDLILASPLTTHVQFPQYMVPQWKLFHTQTQATSKT